MAGNRLSLRPKSTRGVVVDRDGRVTKRSDPPLEPVTYLAQLVLFEGLGETQLVLTPPAETRRDGPFGGNDRFRSSYLLSATYRPEWRAFPK